MPAGGNCVLHDSKDFNAMPKQKCCICKSSTSRRFTDAKKIDPTCLIKCFELQERKEGALCEACRRLVSKHKQDHCRTYPLVVNSRGRTGISNRKQAIAKRTEHLLSLSRMIPVLLKGPEVPLLKPFRAGDLTVSVLFC